MGLLGAYGLWEHWVGESQEINSCTILTVEANSLIGKIHSRMPAIITPEDYAIWLDPNCHDAALLKSLLKSFPADQMTMYPVSRQVNNPSFNTLGCTEPIADSTA